MNIDNELYKKNFKLLCEKYSLEQIYKPLEELGFFSAPASSKYHLNYRGGLLAHSFNVFKIMIKLKNTYNISLLERDIFLSAFLHDLDKVSKYKAKEIYDSNVYIYNDVLGLQNGIGSLYLSQELGLNRIELNKDVAIAITYHMGFWEFSDFKNKINEIKKFPYAFKLLNLLRNADEIATFFLEEEKDLRD